MREHRRKEWGRNGEVCLGVREVSGIWGRSGRVYGVSVEVVLKWGKVCWDAERCGGAPTLFYTFFTLLPTPPHSPNTYFHTHPTPPPHPHSPDTSLHFFPHSLPTLSHTFPHLSSPPLTYTSPDTFPSPPPTLPTLTPHTSSQPPRLLQHLIIFNHSPLTKISHFSHLLPN